MEGIDSLFSVFEKDEEDSILDLSKKESAKRSRIEKKVEEEVQPVKTDDSEIASHQREIKPYSKEVLHETAGPMKLSTQEDKPLIPTPSAGTIDESKSTVSGKATVIEKPAKTYPFTLDPFQQEAIGCLERDESVLVSAHTSAGKTVVAEYAIAMALRDKQRVIYTSPIKVMHCLKHSHSIAVATVVACWCRR